MAGLNFYSDTQTRPSRAMLAAACDADLGDEQRGTDPTTARLCERVAALLGHEAAVLLPSGTMCNEIALAVHGQPGDEVICDRVSHIVTSEAGGPAALSGLMIRTLDGERGRFTAAQLAGAMRSGSRYEPVSRIVEVEQSCNHGGGAVWPLGQLREVLEVARAHGLAAHMDGARLMNAVVATGVPAADHAGGFDSAWIDFTKGLGCPVGAVLAGSAEFIGRAWRLKQRWGGAMRQSGVLAAMCLYALDHNVERLAEDHRLARMIGERLNDVPGVAAVLPVQTNIVIFDLAETAPEAKSVVAALAAQGVGSGAFGPRRMRVVTHMDVDEAGAHRLCEALECALG
jgi:threonine aldolase